MGLGGWVGEHGRGEHGIGEHGIGERGQMREYGNMEARR